MPEETTATTETEATEAKAATEAAAATQTGEDALPDEVKAVLAKERKARRDAEKRASSSEAEVKKYADRDKSQADKDAEEKATAQREAADAKTEALRLRVALEKKVPAELIDRLRGSTKDELEADADELLKLVKPDATGFDGGARGTSVKAGDMDTAIRQAAGYGSS